MKTLALGPLRSLVPLAAITAVIFTARASFADHYRVPSGSMEPTVQIGDHIVVSKLAYGLRIPMTDRWLIKGHDPRRGDVVVLDRPNGEESADSDGSESPDQNVPSPTDVLLKRVVALSGEVVEVREGRVYIDGRRIDERWASTLSGTGPDFGPARVPAGELLVLGDNRGNSRDGRFFGFVDVRRVLGRALAVVVRDGRVGYEAL